MTVAKVGRSALWIASKNCFRLFVSLDRDVTKFGARFFTWISIIWICKNLSEPKWIQKKTKWIYTNKYTNIWKTRYEYKLSNIIPYDFIWNCLNLYESIHINHYESVWIYLNLESGFTPIPSIQIQKIDVNLNKAIRIYLKLYENVWIVWLYRNLADSWSYMNLYDTDKLINLRESVIL